MGLSSDTLTQWCWVFKCCLLLAQVKLLILCEQVLPKHRWVGFHTTPHHTTGKTCGSAKATPSCRSSKPRDQCVVGVADKWGFQHQQDDSACGATEKCRDLCPQTPGPVTTCGAPVMHAGAR